jgi:3D (Asp-Asp-Asp) domain-containing protein
MRFTILIQLGFLLLLSGTTVKAQTYSGSSKTTFSKTNHNVAPPDNAPVPTPQGRLARVTAYWPGEDRYTTRRQSATGVRLKLGYCAVDSRIIPYGSLVTVFGVGNFLAVDTGTAVISRKAARESGHNRAERSALVVDLFFPSRRAGERFDREGPKFALVAWTSADTLARD